MRAPESPCGSKAEKVPLHENPKLLHENPKPKMSFCMRILNFCTRIPNAKIVTNNL